MPFPLDEGIFQPWVDFAVYHPMNDSIVSYLVGKGSNLEEFIIPLWVKLMIPPKKEGRSILEGKCKEG